ncbi:MAG: lamin tail domain-containing protein [Saprospiraceae bacterium]|nr:lamin tail domain-containing protein [Saprospiraceae bacterium]MBK9632687.1 lamin tail domain-containing protein [Saprospiraceae bacterium]
MNKLKFICFCIYLIFNDANAQVIINEIMYNPPEFGNDKLEYIEFYNTSPLDISLKDFFIEDAVEIIFPDTVIKGFGYFVICVDQLAFDTAFGFKALEWRTGALRNDSEVITLMKADTTVMDSIRYFDTNGWTKEPDGSGPSLELCRQGVDRTIPTYWRPSSKGTGKIFEGFELKGTPGAINEASCGDLIIEASNFKFIPADITINVGEQIEWRNIGGFHNVNGTKASFPQNPEGFGNGAPSGSSWSFIHRFDIPGNYQFQSDPNPAQMNGNILVKVGDTEYPFYPIAKIKTNKVNGTLDSLGVKCQLDGLAYGVNFRPAGLQFTIIDDQGDGIAVFSSTMNFGYTVKEGDRLSVRGVITQFNGLAQITVDTILLLSQNNVLITPRNVSILNEASESNLVKIQNVSLVNPVQWSKNPIGFTVRVTNGINTFDVRIDNDNELVSKDAPGGTFDLTGIGQQNDPTDPHTEGYQIWPRYTADIFPYIPGNQIYTRHKIEDVKKINSNGVLDSLNSKVELIGVVHGIDINGTTGLQFTIIDETGGIAVFDNTRNFGYQVKEGDEIVVQGRIDQFRGLAEIVPDTLWRLSTLNPLEVPRTVTDLDESTESELVKMVGMTIVNPSEWVGNGLSANIRLSDGVKEFIMRIDDNTDLASTLPISNRITVTGLGYQFDNSLPYDGDYQIMPRYKADINFLSAADDFENLKNSVFIYPNPTEGQIIFKGAIHDYTMTEILTLNGQMIVRKSFESVENLHLPQGMYLCKLYKHDGNTNIIKLMMK